VFVVRNVLIQGNPANTEKSAFQHRWFSGAYRLPLPKSSEISFEEVNENALDDFCDSVGFVVGRTRVELHDGGFIHLLLVLAIVVL
jgi:hypothetical protein